MPFYFMHLIDSTDVLLDRDGMELAPGAISSAALKATRDCMARDVQNGQLDLHYRIEVQDESGQVIHRLDLEEALEIAAGSQSANVRFPSAPDVQLLGCEAMHRNLAA